MSKQPPSVIYLQYSEEGTWCADRQHDTDVKYVLESAVIERDKQIAELRQQAEKEPGAVVTAVKILCERKWGAARGAIMEDYPDIARIIGAAFAELESALKERDAKIAELNNACRHALTIVKEYESSIDENGRGFAGTIVLRRLLEAALVAEREGNS